MVSSILVLQKSLLVCVQAGWDVVPPHTQWACLTAILGCGTNWSHGNEHCCERKSNSSALWKLTFQLLWFFTPLCVTEEEQGCPWDPGTPSTCCRGVTDLVPKGQGSRKGHWSETLAEAGGGQHGREVGELWDKRTCDTRTVLLHGQKRNIHFPSFLFPCSPHSLILDLFPLSSHWAPGGQGMGWRRVLDRKCHLQAFLDGHRLWSSAPWGHGIPLAEHLPLRLFWFWSSCIYLKSTQMLLEVPSGQPDIFNQRPIISIIRNSRPMLKNFLSLICSPLHFRQNTDDLNEHEIADPYSPKPPEGLSHVLKSQYPQVCWERLHGRCSQLWTGETTLLVTTNFQNTPQAALQISSRFRLWHHRFMPIHSRTSQLFQWFGVISSHLLWPWKIKTRYK